MDGKAFFQESVLGGITFFLVPQIGRRKETMMVAQKEETDGALMKKKSRSYVSS